MIITYHGVESVKISAGDTTLAFNPVSKDSKCKSISFGSDVVFVSLNHPDMNGVAEASRGDKEPFVIRSSGEYEARGTSSEGTASVSHYDGIERINTIYTVLFDNMTIVYLGALDGKVPSAAIEDIDSIDVLFVPVGGEGVLDPAEAHKIAVQLEPKIIIPIHWDGVGEKDALKKFLKEAGSDASPVDKLTIRRKDIEGKEGEVVVLAA